MNCDQANQISIVDFLSSLGIEPKSVSGRAYWYLSPLRIESHASLKVDSTLNRWYDHGLGKGGKLVDLGTEIMKVSVSEFLDMMSKSSLKPFILQKQEKVDIQNYEITSVGDLVDNNLIGYLESRAIDKTISTKFCKEIDYKIEDRNYRAIGFQNDSDGFELRNKYIKLCLNRKDITSIIRPASDNIILFEGFIDFLSWYKISGPIMGSNIDNTSFIILNSVNQVERAKGKLSQLPEVLIDAYFDNDEAGKKCFEALKKDYPKALDRSNTYGEFKDLNEMVLKSNRVMKPKLNRHDGLSM